MLIKHAQFLYRNTTGVTEEALKEFSMMFKWVQNQKLSVSVFRIAGNMTIQKKKTRVSFAVKVFLNEQCASCFSLQTLRQREIWSSESPGVQILSALPGLRPAYGGGRRTRPRVWVHTGHGGPQQVSNQTTAFRLRPPTHAWSHRSSSVHFCVCRDGNVSLQEYMAFMISRETENVKSSEEIESAFRALSAENKPYVTKEELYQVRSTSAVIVSVCKSVDTLMYFNFI